MAFDLVSIGLACADIMIRPVENLPPRGTIGLVDDMEMHVGGLAAVTAAVFSKLGGKAAFVGQVGDDSFGEFLLASLKGWGVDTGQTVQRPGTSSPATVVIISADGERTFLHRPGAAAELTGDQIDLDRVQDTKILHWGGPSVTPGLDGEPIGRIFKEAKQRGLMTSLDTCYDGTGKWYPRIEHALPHTDVVMSSLEEARMFTGCGEEEEIADFYLARGARIVLLKLGPDGLLVKSETCRHQLPALSVQVVDTTGAGDAACGGFLYGISQDWDLLRCAELANAVGAATVRKMGGAEGVESLEQVLMVMDEADKEDMVDLGREYV